MIEAQEVMKQQNCNLFVRQLTSCISCTSSSPQVCPLGLLALPPFLLPQAAWRGVWLGGQYLGMWAGEVVAGVTSVGTVGGLVAAANGRANSDETGWRSVSQELWGPGYSPAGSTSRYHRSPTTASQPVTAQYKPSTRPVPGQYQASTRPVPAQYQASTRPVPAQYKPSTSPVPGQYQANI